MSTVERTTRPCPDSLAWCASHPSEEYADGGGWHEVLVGDEVFVRDEDRGNPNDLHVALDVNHWTGSAAEARELAAELVRAAEVAERIGAS